MKAVSILGTSSGAGKSWLATALCAWLRERGVRVAPFKAQNMSNNAFATHDGGEIARAQAVQAEACGLLPRVEMNPFLLKPSGENRSQVIELGRVVAESGAIEYFRDFERRAQRVRDTLDFWSDQCDVLVIEGAGSPVELNLMGTDLANLLPLRHLDGRWLLVGDIDRGGIFAQLAGTWHLLPEADRSRGLGAIINRFRGDPRLFTEPQKWFRPYAAGLNILGTLPYRPDLQPEEEDGIRPEDLDRGEGDTIAWLRYPCVANVSDAQPWWEDKGVRTRWTDDPEVLAGARMIVLPGTKNTIGDLRWLKEKGLDRVVMAAAARGVTVVGICGGYQMLGARLIDREGIAGDSGEEQGLGLLPTATEFYRPKVVRQVTAIGAGQRWPAYEIHLGHTKVLLPCEPTLSVDVEGVVQPEGVRTGPVLGSYLHGFFDDPQWRKRIAAEAGLEGHRVAGESWASRRRQTYTQMAALLDQHVNLDPVRRYLGV